MTKQERKFRELAKHSPLMKVLYLLWKSSEMECRQAERTFAKLLNIEYCEDLAEEGEPWEVPAEPEPQYFATLKEAIDFRDELAEMECRKLREELRQIGDSAEQALNKFGANEPLRIIMVKAIEAALKAGV